MSEKKDLAVSLRHSLVRKNSGVRCVLSACASSDSTSRLVGSPARRLASSEHLRARGDTAKFPNPSTLLRRLANDRHCVSDRDATLARPFRVPRGATRRGMCLPPTLPRLVSRVHDSGAATLHPPSCSRSHSERLRFSRCCGGRRWDTSHVRGSWKNSNRFY